MHVICVCHGNSHAHARTHTNTHAHNHRYAHTHTVSSTGRCWSCTDLIEEGFLGVRGGVLVLHVAHEGVRVGPRHVHPETQQGLVPARRVLHIPELEPEVERAHLLPESGRREGSK